MTSDSEYLRAIAINLRDIAAVLKRGNVSVEIVVTDRSRRKIKRLIEDGIWAAKFAIAEPTPNNEEKEV